MTHVKSKGVVTFRFYRPGAERVSIAGDFNEWRQDASMRDEGNGWWSADLSLPAGEYRFKYLADGQWYPDYAAHGVEMERGGTWRSLLVVRT